MSVQKLLNLKTEKLNCLGNETPQSNNQSFMFDKIRYTVSVLNTDNRTKKGNAYISLVIAAVLIFGLVSLVLKPNNSTRKNKADNESEVIYKKTEENKVVELELKAECALLENRPDYTDITCRSFENLELSEHKILNNMRVKQIKISGGYYAILAEPVFGIENQVKTIIGDGKTMAIIDETGTKDKHIVKFEYSEKYDAMVIQVGGIEDVSIVSIYSTEDLTRIKVEDKVDVIPPTAKLDINDGNLRGDFEIDEFSVNVYLKGSDSETTTVTASLKDGLVLSYKKE
jgi:hypothetical protein